ncbi:MAG: SUF system Fe-S cluster assembly regulator [Gammaproteobacteria bacterium]|nr:SUF system Fe-S cluster assembly regulator [Gammaproteobacteria bacterium]
MLRLTKLTDYGILLLTHIAADDSRLFASNDLSKATHIPSPTVSKVLQALLGAGLLESIRGAKGGYRLSRPAAEVSVREVIDCFEGHIALTECNLDDGECEQLPFCSTQNNWKRINGAVRDALDSISLQDMTEKDFMPVFSMKKAVSISSVDPSSMANSEAG